MREVSGYRVAFVVEMMKKKKKTDFGGSFVFTEVRAE